MELLSTLCSHTGESNSSHRHFAEGQLAPWGTDSCGEPVRQPMGLLRVYTHKILLCFSEMHDKLKPRRHISILKL